MADTITWPGKSGNTYTYWLNLPGGKYKDEGGNYGFAKQLSNGNFVPLYFGKADSLHNRLSNLSCHERWAEAVRLGASHVMSHTTPAGDAVRCAEEADLIQRWQPPLNVQHRKVSL